MIWITFNIIFNCESAYFSETAPNVRPIGNFEETGSLCVFLVNSIACSNCAISRKRIARFSAISLSFSGLTLPSLTFLSSLSQIF
eukprot:UN00756